MLTLFNSCQNIRKKRNGIGFSSISWRNRVEANTNVGLLKLERMSSKMRHFLHWLNKHWLVFMWDECYCWCVTDRPSRGGFTSSLKHSKYYMHRKVSLHYTLCVSIGFAWLTKPELLKLWVATPSGLAKCNLGVANKHAWQITYKGFCNLYNKIKSRPAVNLSLLHF